MSWRELESAAPALATTARARFDETRAALLGTIRADGMPRISPIEPYFLGGELAFGVMRSPKLDDLQRDARCVVHSIVRDGSGAEAEIKLYGRARAVDDPEFVAAPDTWWRDRPRETFEVFLLELEEAVIVAWDPDFGRMRTQRWVRGGEPRDAIRTYP